MYRPYSINLCLGDVSLKSANYSGVNDEVSNAKSQKRKERQVKDSTGWLCELCIFAPLRWKLNLLTLLSS